ncbi:hypothetical protein GQ54DRAFT_255601 [Martensiomyces pterosporus]|nr:hypothetical protein GQ54DRAFT_255601 [Martensiomyces pterosporus]
MNILRLWWEDKVAAAASHSSADSSRVVVVLQDLEGFPPLVVDDFIRIAGNCCGSVPIVLVLGLATSYESLHQSLTKASISTLNVERFNLQRSKQCIDAIISKVLVRCMATLSFGAEAYKSLLDQFLLYNFSITAFVRKMKYAAMDFFYAHPLSVLVSMVKQTESGTVSVIDCPIQLSHDQAELIRMQRSVQRFLEHHVRAGGDRDYFNRAVNDDGFLQTVVVPQMLRKLASYRQLYSLGIDFAQAIQDESPESMRKPIRTLHYYGLSQTYGECTHWKTLSAIVRKMKAPEMELLLAKLCHIADRAVGVDWRLAAESGLDIPERLRQAQALLADPEGDNSAPSGAAATERTSGQGQTKRIRTRTDMESRPFLLFDSSSSDHVLRALDKCSGMIEDILRSCLSAYRDVPLQEVFYYKHSLLLDTTFSAQPRAAVQAALGKTAYYINCECCKASASSDEDGSEAGMGGNDEDADQRIVPSMQDTSIAYRLHQECGRMINLYDWYSAFSSVVEKEEFTAGRAPDQSETQARFLRAVEEMRLLGFIKSTQRKTDHVVRLTWGM